MEKTNMMAEFIITGDHFEPKLITEQIGIEPSGTYIKGEKIDDRDLYRKETCWFLETDYQESFDVNQQLNYLLNLLEPHIEKLKTLRMKHNLNFLFSFSIRVMNNESPAISIEQKAISIAYDLKAEFDFDLYIL
ncbi:DUF4279 domain-containing protein [Paenibacillus sp. JNUCC31]|uniref:DUF4279 domain-containing protein n=1 Tax=Paenibacillus sp. JNUCC-31 TaxID=2777983 RepID=UPI001780BAE7|nr:DUF4279 domain-containing protein [Paenibacillus sp. JNUCC-31]QOS80067.1 DUF4279 domain-containing protein [Paenibacillus sp. JNUCC-31]